MVILEDNTMVSLGGTFNTGDSSSLARCISKMIVMEVRLNATTCPIIDLIGFLWCDTRRHIDRRRQDIYMGQW